ncbi:MAG: alpha/beta hydrolase [Rhodobacteraceae bacterium]|nr:alpha/beta hydrolase [Paracoccaceae bacterium]
MSESLVFLPGMFADARLFAPQIAAFSRERVVSIAPAGRGERLEEIASDLLGQLPPRFALAAHGFGGAVAFEMLRRAPERITRIALISTTPLADTPDQAAAREPQIVAARTGGIEAALAAQYPAASLAPGPGRPVVLAQLSAMAAQTSSTTLVGQIKALQQRKDQQAVLRNIKQPALVLCGAHDSVLPVRRHEIMAQMIPYARLEVIEDAGCLPMLEAAETTNAALYDWLRQPVKRS